MYIPRHNRHSFRMNRTQIADPHKQSHISRIPNHIIIVEYNSEERVVDPVPLTHLLADGQDMPLQLLVKPI